MAWRLTLALLLAALASASAQAQPAPLRVWDIALGTPVDELPANTFFDPACGTNGGPPSLRLGALADFADCPQQADGLYEVWFIYDDTLEYVARARRDAFALAPNLQTAIEGQPVIVSLLIDAGARIRGYRVFTDPKAEPETRLNAYATANYLRGRYGADGWECLDRPQGEREAPLEGLYINRLCTKQLGDVQVTHESRLLRKTGQRQYDERGNLTVNEFESWSRLEVVAAERSAAVAVPQVTASPPPPPGSFPTREAAFLAGASPDCPRCQLAGADLRRRDLTGASLAGADLTGAQLHRAMLMGADLSDAKLSGANLNLAELGLADLSGATLVGAMLFHARAGRADLSGADLSNALMGEISLAQANLAGANVEGADLGDAHLVRADLSGARLSRAYLFGADLVRAKLVGAIADHANFAGTILRQADLSSGLFELTDFLSADLSEADLSNGNFTDARLTLAKLYAVKRDGADFTRALMPD